jgi:hypothetical protein
MQGRHVLVEGSKKYFATHPTQTVGLLEQPEQFVEQSKQWSFSFGGFELGSWTGAVYLFELTPQRLRSMHLACAG